MILLFGMPGGTEIFIILIVILLIFGGKKIPELMKGLGKGVSEFKKGVADIENIKSDVVNSATKTEEEK